MDSYRAILDMGSRLNLTLIPVASLALLSCACTPTVEQPGLEAVCKAPIIVEALIDQTKSMRSTSTTTPATEDFDPLIEKLGTCGGELDVGFVRDRPRTDALRLRFPEPPALPDKPVQAPEEENYEFGDRMADYGRRLLDRRNEIADTRTKLDPTVQAFRRALRERLSRPLADHTDFNSALNDAEVFLASALDSGWRSRPKQYLIINSDALDEKRKQRLNIKSGATVFWINTSTDDKALSGFQFTRFSDFASAVRQITDK
jgi:hypothetical protein